MTHLFTALAVTLVAAPGASLPTAMDVPSLTEAALARRVDLSQYAFKIESIRPSTRMPGFVSCGTIEQKAPSEGQDAARRERFFVVIPGDFALLDRDGRSLLDNYWSANHC